MKVIEETEDKIVLGPYYDDEGRDGLLTINKNHPAWKEAVDKSKRMEDRGFLPMSIEYLIATALLYEKLDNKIYASLDRIDVAAQQSWLDRVQGRTIVYINSKYPCMCMQCKLDIPRGDPIFWLRPDLEHGLTTDIFCKTCGEYLKLEVTRPEDREPGFQY